MIDLDVFHRACPESEVGPSAADFAHYLETRLSGADPTTSAALENWRGARYELLAARMYPIASGPCVALAADTVLWLFLVDGCLDPGGPCDDPDYVRALAAGVEQVLADGPASDSPDPILRFLAGLIDNAKAFPGEPWVRSLLDNLRSFVNAMAIEHDARSSRNRPTALEYLTLRRDTSGWKLLVDLLEPAFRINIPADVRESSEFQALRQTAGDLAQALNDVHSLCKEREAGEYHNLALLTSAEDFGRLFERMLFCHEAAKAAFLARFAGPSPFSAKDYAAALELMLRATSDWAARSERYES
ncbi:terpene synthase family protein [Lentzea alba]|uniref:terpene synthase family protein n=1 Tax=Lentzea alba TaxID=2714351 RepID=UPI0039BF5258